MTLLLLFWEFFKTGLFSIGGGMATLPFLYDMAERHGDWFTSGQLTDMIAVSESTPGPIGVNMATYVGYLTGGIVGAVVATLGLITPSIIVILILSRALETYRDSRVVKSAFYGLRPASLAMIAGAFFTVANVTFLNGDPASLAAARRVPNVDFGAIILAAVLLLFTRVIPLTKKWHPIIFILLSAGVGIVFRFAGA